jgi:hypothetical protein
MMLVDWGQQNVYCRYKESDRRLLEVIEQEPQLQLHLHIEQLQTVQL